MYDICDSLFNRVEVCVDRDRCNIRNKLHRVCIDLCIRVWVVAFKAAVMVGAGTYVPAFDAVVVP